MSAERAVKVKTNWGVRGMVADSRSQGVRGFRVESISNMTSGRIFCPTPEFQLDQFFHHTLKLGIPVEMAHFLSKLLLKQRLLLSTTFSIDC